MQDYQHIITVRKEDLDALQHVNNVRYVQWVNDIAKMHWEIRATPEMLESYYWVMLEHHLSYKGPAFLHDTLVLKTFVTRAEGVRSTRVVEIHNKDSGKLLFKAESHWCFMSKAMNRPARIPQELKELFD